jgi:putative transposase
MRDGLKTGSAEVGKRQRWEKAKNDHPSKWLHGGYNEIQVPRRKNIIIAYDRLRELAGFKDYESFASAHRKWVQSSLERMENKRDRRWTESFAVGSNQFARRIKTAMGAMARGRSVQSIDGASELREPQSAYSVIFDPENRDIDRK